MHETFEFGGHGFGVQIARKVHHAFQMTPGEVQPPAAVLARGRVYPRFREMHAQRGHRTGVDRDLPNTVEPRSVRAWPMEG